MSTAAFRARNVTQDSAWSPFSDGGFDAAPGDVIEVQIEDSPAPDLWQTAFYNTDRSDGRTAVTFDPSDGIAATPTDPVQFTLPAERGTWEITCRTNDGAAVPDANGDPDYRVNNKARFFAVRTENLELRHPLAGETTEYTPHGMAVALQEMMDAADAGAGGGSTPTMSAIMTPDAGGTPVNSVWFLGSPAGDAFNVAANSLRLVLPMFGLATSDTDFYTITVSWFEADGTEHQIAVATTEDTTGMGTTGNAFLPGGPIVERVQYPITHAGTTIDAGGVLGIFCEVGGGTPGPAWFAAYL